MRVDTAGLICRSAVGSAGVAALLLLAGGSPAQAVECGDVITTDTALDRNLVCTTDPALTVDSAVLDLRHFTVTCDQTSVGILVQGFAARLRTGAVTGCQAAIVLAGSGEHRVRDVTASASNQGVLIQSDGNLLTLSRVLRGRDDAAVQVDGSGNRLRFNEVGGSTDQGFEINGNDNTLYGNRISGVAEGVQLQGEGNRVQRNDIIGASERGVEVRAGGHRIVNNLIADGALDGIVLFSSGNRVTGNTVLGHGDQGLFVSGLDNTLARNRVLLNAVDLTDTNPACDNNEWRDNIFETSVSEDCVD